MTPSEMKVMDELTRICDYCGDPICVKNGTGFCSKQCENAYYEERDRFIDAERAYEPPEWLIRKE